MNTIDRLVAGATLLCSTLVCSFADAQPSNQLSETDPQPGMWIGGIGSLDDDTLSWFPARVEFEQDGDELHGILKTNHRRRYSVRFHRDGEDLKLSVNRKRERIFDCELSDGVIVATIDDGDVPNKLMLRPVEPLPAERLQKLGGVYETATGQRISFRHQGEGLAMTNFTNGMVRFLYPASDDHFVAGPAMAIPGPVETKYQFYRDGNGKVSKVSVQRVGDQSFDALRRPGPRIEEFVYDSFDDTKIAGTLYRPVGKGPFPALIWVHGSGQATRLGAGSWPLYFTDLGFALLAVDKRGVGKSAGKYSLPNRGGRDNLPHMRRRSKDVAAAVEALGRRDDIQNEKIGLVGGSQAGWVIPMSAQHIDVAFAIILSGGATPLSVEGKYSRMASENASGSQLKPVDELIDELRSYQPSDLGIEKELSEMEFPSLWLYGYRDRSNPSQICEGLINEIASRHHLDFRVKTFPTGNHGLLDSRFGGSAEYRTLSRLVPELHVTIAEWLEEKRLIPK